MSVVPRGFAVSLVAALSVLSGCYRSTVVSDRGTTRGAFRPPTVTRINPPVFPVNPRPNQPRTENSWKPTEKARNWQHIVIHHTASNGGSVESIHEGHLAKGWLGIGYHFVIGNGNGMSDGAIEPTFRWRQQMHGAHAGVKEYNELGIGICLVGNFQDTQPTEAQLASVKRLVRTLSQEYQINADRVVGHRDVKSTACPGKNFPLSEVKSVASGWTPRFAGSSGRSISDAEKSHRLVSAGR
ncbi:MAG: N-acetylmuramoyl-L-alanine amidase [Planctomycetaceae bacterium]|nr:N-acetylmuramoyl-L-alanine amidase [Planctomycetaceae bacterium]